MKTQTFDFLLTIDDHERKIRYFIKDDTVYASADDICEMWIEDHKAYGISYEQHYFWIIDKIFDAVGYDPILYVEMI
jgi:hypothetical protein